MSWVCLVRLPVLQPQGFGKCDVLSGRKSRDRGGSATRRSRVCATTGCVTPGPLSPSCSNGQSAGVECGAVLGEFKTEKSSSRREAPAKNRKLWWFDLETTIRGERQKFMHVAGKIQ